MPVLYPGVNIDLGLFPMSLPKRFWKKEKLTVWRKMEITLLCIFIDNRKKTQLTTSSDVIENQTGSTVICAELTDPEIQPDHTTYSNDADPNLPKIIVDPEYTTEFEKESTKGKTILS